MQPVVDRIENEYGDIVTILRINASTKDGLEIFNAYSLFGHPAYLILDEHGQVLWQGIGEQPASVIEDNLLWQIQDYVE
jgi:hypothetical protein